MDVRNFTPFPHLYFFNTDNRGREFGIFFVKGTYSIGDGGLLTLAEEQAPLIFTDTCFGAVNETSLWHPTDLVPYKPRTDIIVHATARAPGGTPLPAWEVGVRVEPPEPSADRPVLEKRLRVTGPRFWQPRWKRALSDAQKQEWKKHHKWFDGWELTAPEPTTEVALRYENAFGGSIMIRDENGIDQAVDSCQHNPLGCGMIDPERTDHTRPHRAPQIEAWDEPITDPYGTYTPHSLGPIPPAWLPRRPLGGTFDQNWIDTVWPNWPADYDFAYNNSAHPDLIYPGFLYGDERITLSGINGKEEPLVLTLPGESVGTAFLGQEAEHRLCRLALDTVMIDTVTDDTDDGYVVLIWRGVFDKDRTTGIDAYRTALSNEAAIPLAPEDIFL